MKSAILQAEPWEISISAAHLSLAASVVALVSLAGLHILSPEFDPSWRVVSEYALGRHGWILSLMFLAWALSSWFLALAIRPEVRTIGGQAGLVFLVAAGVGEAMASVFDLRQPALHGLAGAIGVPSLPIAAMLISVSLSHTEVWSSAKKLLLWTANLTWMSFALMAAAMLTLTHTIAGHRVLIGWPNRLLIVIYLLWAMVVAWRVIRARGKSKS